ncbi:MAG TPA: hypothetical protein VIU64_22830 [Polyangia bacterium]
MGRVDAVAREYAPTPIRRWCGEAALTLQRQLEARGALPHASIAVPAAEALGLNRPLAEGVGLVFDLLQTAIDVADNIADVEEDASAGRPPVYLGIPKAALICLPSLLTGMALSHLTSTFEEGQFGTSYSCRRILQILGAMTLGQSVPKPDVRHDQLVSGRQGVLLCLPFWLVAKRSPAWRRRLPRVERWSYRFGLTWEARERRLDMPTGAAVAAHQRSLVAAQRAWPDFAPFRPGDALSAQALIAGGLS